MELRRSCTQSSMAAMAVAARCCSGASFGMFVARTQPEAMGRAKVECLLSDMFHESMAAVLICILICFYTGLDSPVRPQEGGWIGLFRPFRPGRPLVPQLTKELARTYLHYTSTRARLACTACAFFSCPLFCSHVAYWHLDIPSGMNSALHI